VVSFDKKNTEPLLFAWKSDVGPVDTYELQFSSDPEFKNILAERSSKDSKLIFKESLVAPRIFWRVRAVTGQQKTSWSKPRSYQIISGS
jgi:hypothetical protein